ncbi:MAG: diguanylate cyclase [Phycisphaeraceae bacterium]|nr:diguanylate cyclase [Phycisphaeraceae bacterium]
MSSYQTQSMPVPPMLMRPRSSLTRRLLGWSLLMIASEALVSAVVLNHVARQAIHGDAEATRWIIQGWLPLLAVATGFVVAAPLAILAARRWLSPLNRLIDATRKLAEGQAPSPVPVVGHDELAILTEMFNQMARISQASQRRLQFANEELMHANRELEAQVARRTVELEQTNRDLQAAVNQLQTMATTDGLTGVANRRAFNQALQRAYAEAKRRASDLACVMIDLDGFKQLNDTQGHPQGDALLVRCARVLQSVCRASDVAGRFGGDEFALVLPGADEKVACLVAQRVREGFLEEIREMARANEVRRAVTMSIGVACLHTSAARDADHLLSLADQALYQAKRAGRDRVMVYDDDCPDHAAA